MRYFLEFAYNGTSYHGWQIQPNALSVQAVLEDKMSRKLRQKITLFAAGRTDTGVHAKKMVAHFDYNKPFIPNVILELNGFLPESISVQSIQAVRPNAHARFDAISRTYNYYINLVKNPFNAEFSWQWYDANLDINAMNEAAKMLLSYSDFTSFARLHSDNKTNLCKISHARWGSTESGLIFQITADRFLRNMVRALVGTFVEVGLGKISLTEFNAIIDKKDRSFAAASAPPQGLFLTDVSYPQDIFL